MMLTFLAWLLLMQAIAEDSYLHQSIDDILNNVKKSVNRATITKTESKTEEFSNELNYYDTTASQPKGLISKKLL